MSDKSILEKFMAIDHLIFDVDGVFTDGKLTVTAEGALLRTMNVKDGLALKKALNSGINVTIITGGDCTGVKKRFRNLGVVEYYSGIHDKESRLKELIKEKKVLDLSACLYMGDDLPDIGPMKMVGLPCCPVDATPEVKAAAEYISPYKGGETCVRDVIEKVLKLKGAWV